VSLEWHSGEVKSRRNEDDSPASGRVCAVVGVL
jgi:hypothetical protein